MNGDRAATVVRPALGTSSSVEHTNHAALPLNCHVPRIIHPVRGHKPCPASDSMPPDPPLVVVPTFELKRPDPQGPKSRLLDFNLSRLR